MAAERTDPAGAIRDRARRARRLAVQLSAPDDIARLLLYAEELDGQANDLEHQRARDGG